jgi:hypothetical protein
MSGNVIARASTIRSGKPTLVDAITDLVSDRLGSRVRLEQAQQDEPE